MIVFGALALAACAQHGTGPLTLSPAVSQAYSAWLYSPNPLYFVVSADGQTASWANCNNSGLSGGCDPRYAKKQALQDCQRKAAGKPCYVYSDNQRVMWDGPVSIGAK